MAVRIGGPVLRCLAAPHRGPQVPALRGVQRRLQHAGHAAEGHDGYAGHEDYLSSVDASLGKMEREDASYAGAALTERDIQAGRVREGIMNTVKGVDESVVKLRRIGELFFIAHDSLLPLGVSLHTAMSFLLGFAKFPANRVGYQRHELLWKMYTHMRTVDNRMDIDIARFAMMGLAKAPGQFKGPSLYYQAIDILADMKSADMAMSTAVMTHFFRLASVCEDSDGDHTFMKSAYQRHLEYESSDGFYTNPTYYAFLLNGLVKAQMIEEGLSVINKFVHVPFNSVLATSCVDVCANSDDPSSAMSMYKVLFSHQWSTLKPTHEVFSCLLYAAARNPDGMQAAHIQYICTEMSEKGVRTDDPQFLNRLCISLFAVKRHHLGNDLYKNMLARGIPVWDVTKESIPEELVNPEHLKVLGYDISDRVPVSNRYDAQNDDLSDVKAVEDPHMPKDAPTWDGRLFSEDRRGDFDPRELREADSAAADLPDSAPVFGAKVLKIKKTSLQSKRMEAARERRAEDREKKARRAVSSIPKPETHLVEGDSEAGYDVGKLLGL